jgi:HlyD family secretion protein
MKYYILFAAMVFLAACNRHEEKADAYGNFEATEIIVSAETNGKITDLLIEEGDDIELGGLLAVIDTTQLYLKKEQLLASGNAIDAKTQNLSVQIDVLEKQKANLLREKNRVERLLKDSAATTKQLDDISGELEVVDKKIAATKSSISTANRGILSEKEPLAVSIKQIDDMIGRSKIASPTSGTVLKKYIELGEYAAPGKPICKVADLKDMILRVYVSETSLAKVKIGSAVKVAIDNGEELKHFDGTISWVSDKAEFTPKIVQTKEERVNLVYAVKVNVKNDGSIKIGMPGEISFENGEK